RSWLRCQPAGAREGPGQGRGGWRHRRLGARRCARLRRSRRPRARSPRDQPAGGRRYPRRVSPKAKRLAVALESAPKKTFATALDWPGWSRSGKTDELAIEALLAYAPRYAPIAEAAGIAFPSSFEADVVERADGGSGTEFGVPSRIHELDTRAVDAAEAKRLASIVEASWASFDRVVAKAPAELRKGPRGGGRDRDKIVGHVNESDGYYARELGL